MDGAWAGGDGSNEAKRIVLAGDKLYVAGVSTKLDAKRLLALQYRTSGKRLWMQEWDAPVGSVGVVTDLEVDRAGNAIAVGQAFIGDRGLALIASWTSTGQLRWSHVDAPLHGATARAYAVAVNRAGTAWVTGTTDYEASGMLLKYSATGARLWTKYLNLPGSTRNYFFAVCLWGPGSLAVVGSSANDATGADLLVAKYAR